MKKILMWVGIIIVIFIVILQIIPYGRNHNNPPVVQEPNWDSPQTREFAKRACFDCHSNETVWPWYSNIAPVSWLVQQDVDKGRQRLNFSEWGQRQNSGEIYEVVQEGFMPLAKYLPMHPEARFTPEEKSAFLKGILATFGGGD
jgi:cytochrome c551/c552